MKTDACDGALVALLLGLPNTDWAGVPAAAPALKTDACDGALVALLLGLNVDADGDPNVNVVTEFWATGLGAANTLGAGNEDEVAVTGAGAVATELEVAVDFGAGERDMSTAGFCCST